MLGTGLQNLFVELGVGAKEVGLHALRGFVGELDAGLDWGCVCRLVVFD